MFAVPNGHAGSLLIGRLGPYLGHSSKGDGGEKQGEHTRANSTNTCSPPSLHPFHGTSLRVCWRASWGRRDVDPLTDTHTQTWHCTHWQMFASTHSSVEVAMTWRVAAGNSNAHRHNHVYLSFSVRTLHWIPYSFFINLYSLTKILALILIIFLPLTLI